VVYRDRHLILEAGLGVESIPAYSPQAKGRVERFRRTQQDRLVTELRLAGLPEHGRAWLHHEVGRGGAVGTVAVDPLVIPLGSLLCIEGYPEVFTAEDTGEWPLYLVLAGKRRVTISPLLRKLRICKASNQQYARPRLSGHIVEHVSGLPFERYVEERIPRPAGRRLGGWCV
jgi:hypothetical protein